MKGAARFWWGWLVAVAAGVVAAGLGMVVAPGPTMRAFSLLVYASPGRIAGFGGPAASYVALAHGVLGAVMAGWGAALLFLLLGPFRRGLRWAWLAVAVSLAVWFVPDTALSLWSGFWQNAVLNAVLALLFIPPLAGTYRACGVKE